MLFIIKTYRHINTSNMKTYQCNLVVTVYSCTISFSLIGILIHLVMKTSYHENILKHHKTMLCMLFVLVSCFWIQELQLIGVRRYNSLNLLFFRPGAITLWNLLYQGATTHWCQEQQLFGLTVSKARSYNSLKPIISTHESTTPRLVQCTWFRYAFWD
jgi:hypothetical protein